LPADVTCTQCTLQVLEYMSHHPAPCFYHHCADIAIQEEVAPPTPTPTPPPPTSTETPAPSRPCVCDCNQSQNVSIDELVRCVGIALGRFPIESCPAIDPNHQGVVTINALVAAVNNFLYGCP